MNYLYAGRIFYIRDVAVAKGGTRLAGIPKVAIFSYSVASNQRAYQALRLDSRLLQQPRHLHNIRKNVPTDLHSVESY